MSTIIDRKKLAALAKQRALDIKTEKDLSDLSREIMKLLAERQNVIVLATGRAIHDAALHARALRWACARRNKARLTPPYTGLA